LHTLCPFNQSTLINKGTVITFGNLLEDICFLPPHTLFRTAELRTTELLALQATERVSPFDFILKQRLLANAADDLKLSKLISNVYKGDSKPLEEEVNPGNKTMLGTLHWRARAFTEGHLLAWTTRCGISSC